MTDDSKINAQLPSSNTGFSFWRAFGRLLQSSVRYYGLRRTVAQVAVAAYRFFRELLPGRRKARYGDLDYDFDHNVDTTRANVSFRTQLIAALSGHQYFPTEPWLFEQMMQALSQSIQQSALSSQPTVPQQEPKYKDLREFTFIDLGSGKGRCLLMAAPYGFKKIIGVEYMPEWHQVAEENIRRFAESRAEVYPDESCGTGTPACAAEMVRDEGTDKSVCATKAASIKSLCMDARDFEFPAEPLVVYLFNPFPEPVLANVLERLRESFLETPRPLAVAYRFPEYESLFQKCDWLGKVAGTEQWVVYRNLIIR